jgi:hypothetical protein
VARAPIRRSRADATFAAPCESAANPEINRLCVPFPEQFQQIMQISSAAIAPIRQRIT